MTARPAATPALRRRLAVLAEVLGAVLVAVAFYAAVLPRWTTARVAWGEDDDFVEALALEALRTGDPFLLGHPVPPTGLFLGPLFHDTWAGLMVLLGDDPWRWWVGLITLDLLGVLAALVLLRPTLGAAGAWVAVAVLAFDPEYGLGQWKPFWYQPHALPWLVAGTAGLVRFAAGGGRRAWWLALAGAGLASQVHACLWALLPVVAGVTLLRARSLGARDVAVGAAVVAATAWPLLVQLPVLASPAPWASATAPGAGPGPVDVLVACAGLTAGRVPLGAVVVPLAVVAAVARLVRAPAGDPWRSTVAVALAWAGCLLVLNVAVAPRWNVSYAWSAVVPLALLVAHLVASAGRATPALAGVAVVALGLHGRPVPPLLQVPSPAVAWQDHATLAAARQALAAGGVRRDEVAAGHVHGVPCLLPDAGVCPGWTLRVPLDPGGGPLPVDEVRVRLVDGVPRVERYRPCGGAEVVDGVLRTTGCAGAVTHLVLRGAPAALDRLGPLGVVARAATPDGAEELAVVALAAVPTGAGVPVGDLRLLDVFEGDHAWSAGELGLARLR